MGKGRGGWDEIEAEARDAFAGEGRFPLPAYSEFMPSPHVVLKPYQPLRAARAAAIAASAGDALDITEEEQARQIAPGLGKIAGHLLTEIDRLVHGAPHDFSRALMGESGAWSAPLAEAAAACRAAGEPIVLALSICLSRTQDDKGNVRWTLFGLSHDGPGAAFWRSFSDDDRDRFASFVAWARAATPGAPSSSSSSLTGVRVLAENSYELPAFARTLQLAPDEPLSGVQALVTFRPFAALPPPVQQATLAGRLQLIPHPASQILFQHPGYRQLALALPHATQIPLLPLFSHVAEGYQIRIPQSGWLDELADRGARRSQAATHRIVRSHRWQRMARDQRTEEVAKFEDQVSVALFSTDPDDIGLYGKPMARNAQIWTEDYTLILDGPRATPLEIARASATIDRGWPLRLPLLLSADAGGRAGDLLAPAAGGAPAGGRRGRRHLGRSAFSGLRSGRGPARIPRPHADRAHPAAARAPRIRGGGDRL